MAGILNSNEGADTMDADDEPQKPIDIIADEIGNIMCGSDVFSRGRALIANEALAKHEAELNAQAAQIKTLAAELARVSEERNRYQTNLGRIILALPTGHGERLAGAVEGVKMMRARLEARAEAAEVKLATIERETLERAAVMVETTAYTVAGDKRSLEPVSGRLAGRDMHHAAIAAAIRAMIRADLTPTDTQITSSYFDGLVSDAKVAAVKAILKFPQPNYVTLKIAEEAGEVVRGAVHYAEGRMEWKEVEGEIVQLLAMLIRLVTEGDQVNGIIPPPGLTSTEQKP